VAEYDADDVTTAVRRRRGPDPVGLVFGLLALGMAFSALTGQLPNLSGFDPRWVLAIGAAGIGLLMLIGSMRGRR
jgi:hypothetical protein